MTTYFVRAELHEYSDYNVFHAAMERRGFKRTTYEGGTMKDLPSGSYLVDTYQGINDVLLDVLHAAVEVSSPARVVVSGNNQIVTAGLESHNFLLGALAARLSR
jgi:hypothetical protein